MAMLQLYYLSSVTISTAGQASIKTSKRSSAIELVFVVWDVRGGTELEFDEVSRKEYDKQKNSCLPVKQVELQNEYWGFLMSSNRVRRPEGGENLYKLPHSYVAVDTETTGLDFDCCDIIEIGALRIVDGEVRETFNSLVNIGYELDPFIVDLTGITDEMLVGAPPLSQVIESFDSFAGDETLLAHNASFDMNFLYTAYERALGRPLRNDYVDTLRVARRAFPDMQHRRLPDLCERMNVVNEDEHRALADITATVRCYEQMRKIVLTSYGSEETYEKSFSRSNGSNALKAKEIVAAHGDIDESNPLYGMRCVFTGTMTSMVRRDAMQALANIGGTPQDGVRKDTDYLVIGNKGFRDALKTTSGKIDKAKKNQLKGLPIQIISENTFLAMLEN